MKFKKGDKVVAMADRKKGGGKDYFSGMLHPALKTVGIVGDVIRGRNQNRVYVRITDASMIAYRPDELAPIEILREIFGEERYVRALEKLPTVN